MFEQVSFIFPKFLWQNKINNISTERQNKTEKIVKWFSMKLQVKNQNFFQ